PLGPIGQVALGREEDPAIARQDVHDLQTAAVPALVGGDAEDLVVHALLEDKSALLGGMVEARTESPFAAAEVGLEGFVEGSVKRDSLEQSGPRRFRGSGFGGASQQDHDQSEGCKQTSGDAHDVLSL